MRRFAEMTWEEVRDGVGPSVVAILPVGAVEAHGPHLPLGTDAIIAEAMARACAMRLRDQGLTGWILPPLWYTAAPFARNFPGTVSVDEATVRALIVQIMSSLGEQGIRTVAIASAHLDPTHVRMLRSVTESEIDGVKVVFLDLTRRRVAEQLTDEFKTGACHAGRFEGSVVLAETPALFRSEVAAVLEPNPASLSDAIGDGVDSFEGAGGAKAYFGWPAEATPEEGRDTVSTLGALLAEKILQEMT